MAVNEFLGIVEGKGQELWSIDGLHLQTHMRSQCQGEWCCIHRPMPGPWSEWPLHWRGDRGIMERICPCGVGHPAVEQFDHWAKTDQKYQAIHGCCFCPCSPKRAADAITELGQELELE